MKKCLIRTKQKKILRAPRLGAITHKSTLNLVLRFHCERSLEQLSLCRLTGSLTLSLSSNATKTRAHTARNWEIQSAVYFPLAHKTQFRRAIYTLRWLFGVCVCSCLWHTEIECRTVWRYYTAVFIVMQFRFDGALIVALSGFVFNFHSAFHPFSFCSVVCSSVMKWWENAPRSIETQFFSFIFNVHAAMWFETNSDPFGLKIDIHFTFFHK